jgi:hypothetical protein
MNQKTRNYKNMETKEIYRLVRNVEPVEAANLIVNAKTEEDRHNLLESLV